MNYVDFKNFEPDLYIQIYILYIYTIYNICVYIQIYIIYIQILYIIYELKQQQHTLLIFGWELLFMKNVGLLKKYYL